MAEREHFRETTAARIIPVDTFLSTLKSCDMSVETVQLAVSIVGLALAIVGLPILLVQIRDVQRSVRSGAHAAIYAQSADFRAHLVDHPHLRKYFFDGSEIAPDHPEYERVVTIAELFLNYLEHMVVMRDSFGSENRASLERFCRDALSRSPVLRNHLAENRSAYSDSLQSMIMPVQATTSTARPRVPTDSSGSAG